VADAKAIGTSLAQAASQTGFSLHETFARLLWILFTRKPCFVKTSLLPVSL